MLRVLPTTFKPVNNLICCKTGLMWVPWVPEVFLACGGNFRCWPKADTSSAVGRSHERRHYKDLTETGNRTRKVSGTQGMMWVVKRATSLFNSFCSNVARQVACFLLPVFPCLNFSTEARSIPGLIETLTNI